MSQRVAWGVGILLGVGALLGTPPRSGLGEEDERAPRRPLGDGVSNPVVDSLGARLSRAAKKSAPASPPSRFTPSGTRILLGPLVKALVEDVAQRAAIEAAVEAVLRAYEEQAATFGAKDDLAGALCFFLETHYAAAHEGEEIPNEATAVLLRQMRAALDTPETRAASDADKQGLHEFFAIQAAFLLLRMQAAAQEGDEAAKGAVRAAGLEGLRTLLDTEPARLSITAKDGLLIEPARAPTGAPSPPALPPTTPGPKGDSLPLTFATPAAWAQTEKDGVVTLSRTDGDDFYGRSACTLILIPGGAIGDLRAGLRAAWEGLVLPSFDGAARPPPLLRRVGEVGCAFAQEDMTSKSHRAPFQVAAYLLDFGSRSVTLLALVQGDPSLYAEATERVLASVRAGPVPPPRDLFTMAELAGTWKWSSTSIADYVNPAGQFAGDASQGMGETLTFTAEGAYSSHFLGVGRGRTIRAQHTGRFRIEGDMLVLVPDDPAARSHSRRILSVGPSTDGKGSLLLLLNPAYDLRPGNISFYGERFVRP
jgi:hypothetical protein